MGIALRGFGVCEDFECLCEQGIASENGNAFTIDFVIGWLASTQVIVVHRWQIVVNERVGVDAFDGAGGRKCVYHATAAGLGSGEKQGWPHSFASGKE